MNSMQQNIPLLLMQTREVMMQGFRPILNKRNLTEQQWRILRAIYEHKQLEPRELCELCCIISPSMAGILKRMEDIGLIVKVPSTIDKRRVEVSLAAGMEEKIEEIMIETHQAYTVFADQVGTDLLKKLEKNLVEVLNKAKNTSS